MLAVRPDPPRRYIAWRLGLLVAWAGAGCAAAAVRAQEVTVTLGDGRTFTAQVEARTDAERLWLRFGTERTKIVRSFAWSTIVTARQNGTDVSPAALRQQAAAAVNPAAASFQQPSTSASRGGLQLWRVPGAGSNAPFEPLAPIRSLQVDAYAVNWDADVENDGLLVTCTALDDYGRATPIAGVIEAELIGERLPPYSRGNAFPVLGRWTIAATAEGATAGGSYRIRVPFQAVHPDYQTAWPAFALLHVRLTVPGQGTLEASVDGVALRTFSPVRDRLESASGTRFLPTEQTGRSKRLSSRGPTD